MVCCINVLSYRERNAYGLHSDIVKLCLQSTDIYDALELALYVRNYQKQTTKPIIAVAMGPSGQLSRYTAPITFVTHTRIPASNGSDQLTIATINRALHLLGQLPKRTFCLIGSDIFHQLLSAPLTAAFEELGMPYSTFPIYESSQEFIDMMSRPNLGGVSLTASHTLDVGKYVDSSSPSAEQIGFIDTTLVTNEPGKRIIRGYNTFWVAMRRCIENSSIDLSGKRTALVVGAGQKAIAACYALQHLGFQDIVVTSPAEESAQKLAAKFPGISFRFFNDIHQANKTIDPCGSTIIIDCSKHNLAEGLSTGGLFACSSGILIELGNTRDCVSAEQGTCLLGNWKRYSVADVLMEQARVQCKLWTGREPYK